MISETVQNREKELFSSGARASLPAGLSERENYCGLEVRAPLRFWTVSCALTCEDNWAHAVRRYDWPS